MRYRYKTSSVCSSEILFDINNGKVTNIEFVGGCNGNLKAISKLIDGWSAEEIAEKLAGNVCGFKETSCADQLSRAVIAAKKKEDSKSN